METGVETFVGIDVSKDWLDVCDGRRTWRKTNTVSASQKLVKSFKTKPKLVVVESTGGYERIIVEALWDANIPVAVVNPRQTKRFAQGLAVAAKTDNIDAQTLQRFAEMVCPAPMVRPPAEIIALQGLLDRRRQLIEMIVMEKNRAKSPLAGSGQLTSVKKVLAVLQKELKGISAQANEIISKNEKLAAKRALLISEHGVGEVLALTLIGDVPELGSLNRGKIAALMGLAPLNNQSGARDARRFIRGGRKHVRTVLYMATVSAIRNSPTLRPYFLRLVERGKPKKIALIASMRKLLLTLNAKMRLLLTEANTATCHNSLDFA